MSLRQITFLVSVFLFVASGSVKAIDQAEKICQLKAIENVEAVSKIFYAQKDAMLWFYRLLSAPY